jgi:hypothetical protein
MQLEAAGTEGMRHCEVSFARSEAPDGDLAGLLGVVNGWLRAGAYRVEFAEIRGDIGVLGVRIPRARGRLPRAGDLLRAYAEAVALLERPWSRGSLITEVAVDQDSRPGVRLDILGLRLAGRLHSEGWPVERVTLLRRSAVIEVAVTRSDVEDAYPSW